MSIHNFQIWASYTFRSVDSDTMPYKYRMNRVVYGPRTDPVQALVGPIPLTGFIFLNLFGLLECLVMWLISMPVIKV